MVHLGADHRSRTTRENRLVAAMETVRRETERASAIIEVVFIAVLVLVPLIYLIWQ
jgi:hypothetical protein